MLFKLDMGLKLAGQSESNPGFFSNGVTVADLYFDGNLPSVKQRFAKLVMISQKTGLHDLIRDVGMKSCGEDLAAIEDRSLETSPGVTGLRLANRGP